MKYALLLFLAALTASCTDTEDKSIHKVEVLSGGQVVRTYITTGSVGSYNEHNEIYFKDSATGKNINVQANAIITTL